MTGRCDASESNLPQFQPLFIFYYYVRIVQDDNEEAISSPIWVN